MVKNHLKRLTMPRSWRMDRKNIKFAIRPKAGKAFDYSLPLGTVLKETAGVCTTTKEVKALLQNKRVKVNGVVRHDIHFPVGIFDIIDLVESKKQYRLTMDNKGRLNVIEAKDVDVALCKITNKTTLKGGKTQLNCLNGRNIIVDKDEFKTGDVLIMKGNAIDKHLKLEPKATCILIAGKYSGTVGTIEKIEDHIITVKTKDSSFDTLKEYACVIGKAKPEIELGA
jgi:small subunit ribosomal protein S4e